MLKTGAVNAAPVAAEILRKSRLDVCFILVRLQDEDLRRV
jgi:hypothetical protein